MIPTEDRLRDLMVAGLAGDARCYREFLRQLSAFLRAFFRRRMTRFPDDVEDMVQETLLAVHNQRHTYEPGLPLTAWAHAIARYKLVDRLRRYSSHDSRNEVLEGDEDLLSVSEIEAVEARRDLATLLRQLPDRYRRPIVHMKLEGLSVTETARLTGMSSSAVKVGVHRGMLALARLVRDCHED